MSRVLKLLERLREEIPERMAELKPAVEEYARLEEYMEILDKWQHDRDLMLAKIKKRPSVAPKVPIGKRVDNWINAREEGDTFRPRDMQHELEISRNSAAHWINKFVEAGKLEQFGRGLYRRPLERTGEARLRVVTR